MLTMLISCIKVLPIILVNSMWCSFKFLVFKKKQNNNNPVMREAIFSFKLSF